MIQIAAYDPIGVISTQIAGYSFWKEMRDFVFTGRESPDKIEELIITHKIDAILAVSELKSFTDADFIKKVLANHPGVRIIIISNIGDYTEVRKAFIKGVFDYLIYDRLETRLEHTLMRMALKQCDAYFSNKIYDKVQSLTKHIFDGGDNVTGIVHSIISNIYADWEGDATACQQVIEKVKLESYKTFTVKKPWLEKFIYRGDYISEKSFDVKSIDDAEEELLKYYQEVDILFKKYNVIDANKTVYLIGKSVINRVDEKISLESISNDVFLNKTYISYIFKKVTGVSINDFILDVKTDRAKTLLHYPDMSISEIAEILCFCNAGYFSSVFKRYTNMSPTEYRNCIKR